jgi:hypothetical protein
VASADFDNAWAADPVPPGHGEHKEAGAHPEPTCWCGFTLRIDSSGRMWCPFHGEYTEGAA